MLRRPNGSWSAPGGLALLVALGGVSACGDDDGETPSDGVIDAGDEIDADDGPDIDAAPPGPVFVLARESKSGTIAITGDDKYVAMVNPERDSLSVFDTATDVRIAEVTTGDEPSSVVIHGDNSTAFVANRAAATVVKITGLTGGSPTVAATVNVGSEPTGLALSPTGARLYVAEFAEGRISVIDTRTMAVVDDIVVQNPRAIGVTNDLDEEDDDELIVVPEFFGEPVGPLETADNSRNGRVRVYSAADLSAQPAIVFTPFDSGFKPSTAAAGAPTVQVSPNQLWAVAVVGKRIYVPSVSASPAPPTNFQSNVQPVAYVGDLDSGGPLAGPLGTANLAVLVRDQIPDPGPRFFLADLVDVAFVGSTVAYYLSRGGDVVQRVVYEGDGLEIGSQFNDQIQLNVVPEGSTVACQTPSGIVTAHDGPRAYVNCWVTRHLGVINLATQTLIKTVESTVIATTEADVQLGRRFFFTARGRWSNNAWSDCASCHPDGLSDGITWSFAAGPRQTTSMDGSYSHGPGAQKQRVFNWTAIFDEVHDFERNTRGVSGGKGAITVAGDGSSCADVATNVQVNLDDANDNPGGLGQSVRETQDSTPNVCTDDWDKIEAYAKTIRPPRGRRSLDPASVARGAELFGQETALENNAGCVKCHGGAGWTASRLFYVPTDAATDTLDGESFVRPAAWAPTWNTYTTQIQGEPGLAAPNIEQVACVLRAIGTFMAGDLEQRLVNGVLQPAQGSKGFNVPSLYGLAVGAPYLHHGGATTLLELFNDAAWNEHLIAGNPIWLAQLNGGEQAQAKTDLINFLLSIDATTAEQAIPAGFDGCKAGP